MKVYQALLLTIATTAITSQSNAATILSQDFETGSPVNYTLPGNSSPFRVGTTDNTDYWGLSNMAGISLNAGLTGNSTVYLTGQDMDSTLSTPFSSTAPAQIDFTVSVSGFTSLTLQLSMAGMPTAETTNFLRAFTDNDGDGNYETSVFNFAGDSNSAYVEGPPATPTASLAAAFASYTRNLTFPTVGSMLRLRIEMFNDTASFNEAQGIDNILISGDPVPEPTSMGMLLGVAGVLASRRRRK